MQVTFRPPRIIKLDIITDDEGTNRFDDENLERNVSDIFFGFERATPRT